ncbi:hypothetical protein CEXT_38941 [Caerostris extrusa]|uniref:Uncharacterized protein n=1 Tax=Caerostris extrusa TaxID=172846 RepID=A0AAV4NZQ1_CAEEX|nr:hypothetical protein CEXT_38941 [Caerostris extrusa]
MPTISSSGPLSLGSKQGRRVVGDGSNTGNNTITANAVCGGYPQIDRNPTAARSIGGKQRHNRKGLSTTAPEMRLCGEERRERFGCVGQW